MPMGVCLPRCIHRGLYTSEAFIQAHRELQAPPPEPGYGLERVVALMFWSESTRSFCQNPLQWLAL